MVIKETGKEEKGNRKRGEKETGKGGKGSVVE